MKRLDPGSFERARRFLLDRARPLDRARYLYLFEDGPADDVIEALRAFENPDGGFGRAIEPDFRLPDSSVMGTTCAFHALREVGADDSCDLVQGGIRFLVGQWDPARPGWVDVPLEVNDHPHAPWWHREADRSADESWGNPEADVVASFHEHPRLLPPGLLDEVTALALERLAATPAPADRYVALCFLRLADAAPATARATILERLRADARSILDLDPVQLESGEFQPWWLAASHDAPLAEPLRPDIEASLDRELERQHADGYWEPRWSWGGAFPEAWEQARRDWRGSETLHTLLALRGWGRL